MKATLAALTMVGLIGSSAAAQEDINILNAGCRPFASSVRTSAFLMFWLDGASHDQFDNSLHMDRVWDRATKLSAFCARNPNESLRDALDELFYLRGD